jgi:DNA-binding response OmpR family regulator
MIPRRRIAPGELSDLSGRTLLVVDDDDDIVDMVATLTGRYGVYVVRARTVADALAYVDTAPNRLARLPRALSRHLYMKIDARPLCRRCWRRLRGRWW